MIDLYDFSVNTTVIISILLAILLIYKFNHLSSLLKVVGIYIIVGASIDFVSLALYHVQENNLKFLHLFTLFEFVILSYLFKNLFTLFKSKANILYLVIPATFFIIINAFLIQGIDNLNSYSSILSSLLIIGFCIHFFLLLLDVEVKNIQFLTLKWFIICLFFYHSTSLIVMLFGSLIENIAREVQIVIWLFRSTIILLTKLILSYYFVKLFFFHRNLKIQ